jgi:hypothetical protein
MELGLDSELHVGMILRLGRKDLMLAGGDLGGLG